MCCLSDCTAKFMGAVGLEPPPVLSLIQQGSVGSYWREGRRSRVSVLQVPACLFRAAAGCGGLNGTTGRGLLGVLGSPGLWQTSISQAKVLVE